MSNINPKNQKKQPSPKPVKKPVKSAKTAQGKQGSQLRPTMGQSKTGDNGIAKKLNNYIKSLDMRQILLKNMAFVIMGIIMFYIAPRITFIPFPSWVSALIAAAGLKLMVYIRSKNTKKWRKDIEYGSACWGTGKDIKPFIDPEPKNNIILTKTESLTMNPRPKPVKYARNKNVLVIGGSGSGKTRFYVKPNIMQCESEDYPVSFCVTDPKGQILVEMGDFLQSKGYVIKVLNTIDFQKSMGYNPFAYIKSEKDILKFVTALIHNTKGEGKGGDDFWLKAETLLYQALIGYIWYGATRY